MRYTLKGHSSAQTHANETSDRLNISSAVEAYNRDENVPRVIQKFQEAARTETHKDGAQNASTKMYLGTTAPACTPKPGILIDQRERAAPSGCRRTRWRVAAVFAAPLAYAFFLAFKIKFYYSWRCGRRAGGGDLTACRSSSVAAATILSGQSNCTKSALSRRRRLCGFGITTPSRN